MDLFKFTEEILEENVKFFCIVNLRTYLIFFKHKNILNFSRF